MNFDDMSFIIKTDGTVIPCNPKSKKQGFTLDELYASLDCSMVEVVDAKNLTGALSPILICDEEGQYSNKHTNTLASMLAGRWLVGDVLLTESKNFK